MCVDATVYNEAVILAEESLKKEEKEKEKKEKDMTKIQESNLH